MDDGGARASAVGDAAVGEAALAERFARGEAGAFERVVAEYQPRVARLAQRLLGWRGGDLDDAVQDVFLAALTHAGRVRGARGMWPWLAAITVNTCRTRRRREWVRQTFLRTRRGADVAPAADAATEDRECLQRVREALERLPAKDREVIVLHDLEEMRTVDLADVLGVSVNAMQVRLHRARKRLRDELGDVSNA